jgi:sugar O-acyltransferase (sialic acid O-acetyltransferase NeuD family)
MKNLLIIGARGYGREIYNYACQCNELNREWKIKGFLDDKRDALKFYNGYPPIIESVESYNVQADDVFVCALGDVRYKEHYVKIIKQKGGIFIPLIHPTAIILSNTKFGEGFIACPYTSISCDIKIGDFVTIQPFSELGHDVQIGDFCHLNTYTFLGGNVNVGNFATINTAATIIPGISIGNNSVIGAGSVVIKDVVDNCTVFGNPAKIVFSE